MLSRKQFFLCILAMSLLGACSHKKNRPVPPGEITDIKDFFAVFKTVELPFSFSDSTLDKKTGDTLSVPYKVIIRFVPDSFIQKVFGKGVKPDFYPMARVLLPKEGQYLFVKTLLGQKKAVLLLAFDKEHHFLAGVTALKPDQDQYTYQSGIFDKKYALNKSVIKRNRAGIAQEGKEVYVLNESAKNFMLIMTEALDDRANELINPIDTLPRKNKWSADYISGKRNMVSIRDGYRSGRLQFYLHIEKNNGDCVGQLKGEAIIRTATVAEYREDGDPCVLTFIFDANSVTLREQEGCGSHRGIQCTLDGNFGRKKYLKPAKSNVRHI